MGERAEVVVVENTRVHLPGLTARDRELIGQAGPDLLRVDGDSVEVGPVSGVLELEAQRLVVQPKLLVDGATTVAWIAHAETIPTDLASRRQWSVGPAGLREVVVEALATECESLLAHGLLRGYRREEAEATVLRGRLDVARQIARRYGQVDRLHVRRFARRVDIPENLACRAALDRAARTVPAGPLRRRVTALRAAFPRCEDRSFDSLRWLRTARYHRLNARYRAAHRWGLLVLGGGGVDDLLVPGPWPAGTLLVNMNRLWERSVARWCRTVTGHTVIGPAIEVYETGRRGRSYRPDAVLGNPLRPVDAKYKRYGDRPTASPDVDQLLMYGRAFGDVEPLLVYPAPGGAAVRRVVVSAAGRTVGSLTVVGIDVTRPPGQALSAGLAPHLRAPGPPPM